MTCRKREDSFALRGWLPMLTCSFSKPVYRYLVIGKRSSGTCCVVWAQASEKLFRICAFVPNDAPIKVQKDSGKSPRNKMSGEGVLRRRGQKAEVVCAVEVFRSAASTRSALGRELSQHAASQGQYSPPTSHFQQNGGCSCQRPQVCQERVSRWPRFNTSSYS